jgi:hypothetical protein
VSSFEFRHLCGWRGIDATQRHFARQFSTLARLAPHLFGDEPDGKPILLYKAFGEVLGGDPDYPAQQIGDCVSFGHGHGNDLSQCIEIAVGEDAEFQFTDTEFVYATARELAGMLHQSGDGCYGAAAVKAMTTIGMVSRPMLGDSGRYDGQRARSWGRDGAPAELKTAAAEYKLGAAALVDTWESLCAAMQNGYPVTICTGQGFSMQRDNQGFCEPEGQWGHCMCLAGLRFDRPGALVLQSWGHNKPSGRVDLGQPDWSFWVDQPIISRILAEGDSWALSKAPAFKRRDLPAWSYDIAA